LVNADKSRLGYVFGVIPASEELEGDLQQLIAPVQGNLVELTGVAFEYRRYSL